MRQCVEKGIIKGTTLAIDSTHTEANCKKQVPERIITAVDVHNGEYVDGTECDKLLTRTEEAGSRSKH